MGSGPLDVVLSIGLFVAMWIYIAWDRRRVVARRPEVEARVDAVGIWALRALAFSTFVLPFYLRRTRGWPGACAGLAVKYVLLVTSGATARIAAAGDEWTLVSALERSWLEALALVVLAALLLGVSALVDLWRDRARFATAA